LERNGVTKKTDTWMPLLVDKYLGDTTHLTTELHGAYMLLLMAMWKRDGVLPNDDMQLQPITRLSPSKWRAAKHILLAFFRPTEDGVGITQKRLTSELVRAKAHSDAKAKAGAEGAAKRWQRDSTANGKEDGKTDSKSDSTAIADSSQTAWQTGTPIPTPLSNPSGKKDRARAHPPPDDVDAQVWSDWLALRKRKRADVTPTVLDGARSEAAKAGMTFEAFLRVWCLRGTQGMQADWIKPHERTINGSETAHQRAARERVTQIAPSVAAKAPSPSTQQTAEVVDVAARLLG